MFLSTICGTGRSLAPVVGRSPASENSVKCVPLCAQARATQLLPRGHSRWPGETRKGCCFPSEHWSPSPREFQKGPGATSSAFLQGWGPGVVCPMEPVSASVHRPLVPLQQPHGGTDGGGREVGSWGVWRLPLHSSFVLVPCTCILHPSKCVLTHTHTHILHIGKVGSGEVSLSPTTPQTDSHTTPLPHSS